MKIYKQEINDGLQEAMEANNRLLCSCDIVECEAFDVVKEQIPSEFMTAKDSLENPDLFYYKSILASTGINKNGHYFLPEYLWKAKDTAVNKRVNYEHIEHDIIGTDLQSYAIDRAGTIINNDTSLQDLPDNFDVETKGVLYRIWADSKKQKAMDSIINGVKEGKLGVSMEAIFSDFDYVLIAKDGTEEFVPRSSLTAHMSQSLKKFGGSGVYNGKTIGIVLKDFIFAGKGIVKSPANKRSIITEVEDSERNIDIVDKISASVVYSNTEGNNIMEINDAKVKIETLEKQVSELAVANTELNKQLATETSKIATITSEFEAKLVEKQKEVETVTASLNETKTLVEKFEGEKEFARRVELVVASLSMTKEEAVSHTEEFKDLPADKFDKVIASQAKLVAKAIPTVTDKPSPMGGEAKKVSITDMTKKATASLEDAVVEPVLNPSVETKPAASESSLAVSQINEYLKFKK